jgi:hypothetical protein
MKKVLPTPHCPLIRQMKGSGRLNKCRFDVHDALMPSAARIGPLGPIRTGCRALCTLHDKRSSGSATQAMLSSTADRFANLAIADLALSLPASAVIGALAALYGRDARCTKPIAPWARGAAASLSARPTWDGLNQQHLPRSDARLVSPRAGQKTGTAAVSAGGGAHHDTSRVSPEGDGGVPPSRNLLDLGPAPDQ